MKVQSNETDAVVFRYQTRSGMETAVVHTVVVIAETGDLRLMRNCPDWLDDYTALQATRRVLAAMHPNIDATRPPTQKLGWN